MSALANVVPENSLRFLGHDTHSHPVAELVHVVKGQCEFVVGARVVHLRSRESLWIPAALAHAGKYAPDSIVFGALLSDGFDPFRRVHALGVATSLSRTFDTILAAAPSTPEQIRPFQRQLESVLASLTREYFPIPLPSTPIARRIATSATSPRTLDQLAEEQRVSVRHLQRLFREETGLTITQWRTRARLNTAIGRLRAGDDLTTASAAAGYTTRGTLLRALSRESGLSARELALDTLGALEHSSLPTV